jgi:SOS-response transcriptional repressor LexA
MPTDHRAKLATIKRFDQLIVYLRDEMGWPIGRDSFETVDDLFYDFTADELGIDPKTAAKIQEIKRLRPLSSKQPWGIFFVRFEPKRLPIVALRRILGQVALKKRASANSAERAAWAADDLLFVSNYGEGNERQISFAHFSRAPDGQDLPTLRVLGWDNRDTALHLDAVARELTEHLAWPGDDANADAWRSRWQAAFKLKHREVVTTSKELSIRMAELARNIRDRIKTALAIETENGPLTKLMKAFQAALVDDLDADGFADMYAQTIAYGLLSARIADPKKKTADDFAAHMRTNPFLRELMQTFLKVGGRRGKAGGAGIDFDELGVSEVIDLLDDANMEAVVRDFGDRNPQEDPVIHFYELFLKEYDAKKRMHRGVFYTPRPVVSYIVRSVDELLRSEFGLVDGLADTTTWGEMAKKDKDLRIPDGVSADKDFVQILDPATGTGTFLVEVIDLIHKSLVEKWRAQGHGKQKMDALWNEFVPKHLLTRLHGYELLMAPYAIAHLKIGLKLYETGYRFGSNERARVYLTNALEPAKSAQLSLGLLPALAHEAEAVSTIKRGGRFTVVLGNPPYAGFSANHGEWITGLIDTYRFVNGKALDERKVWLKNDYVKFLRLAQHAIETIGQGIVGMITDHSYLDGPTFRGLRSSLIRVFPVAHFLNLHGNSKRREQNPAGGSDENVFEITQGVAIALLASTGASDPATAIADLWGSRAQKYHDLASSSEATTHWEPLAPEPPFFTFARPSVGAAEEYKNGWSITDVFSIGSNGVQTSRDSLVLATTREDLIGRFEWIRDRNTAEKEIVLAFGVEDKSFWRLKAARVALQNDRSWKRHATKYAYRPFDDCWLYASGDFVHRLRREVMQHMLRPNRAIAVGRAGLVVQGAWNLVFVTKSICDHNLFYRGSSLNCPLYRYDDDQLSLSENAGDAGRSHNISPRFAAELARVLGVALDRTSSLPNGVPPEMIFDYAYAVLHSPSYRQRYSELLKVDFPRLPLPSSVELLRNLAKVGGALVDLHLLESRNPERPIAEHVGRRSQLVEKVSWSDGTVWLDDAQTSGFKGVPGEVWNLYVGGYQVCEKWLKDRKGRSLSKEDIAHYQKIIFALSETIRMMEEIDEVIEKHGGWPGAFQAGAGKIAPTKVIPLRPRTLVPKPKERYETCVPLVPLKIAAGAFGDPQRFDDSAVEWVSVESSHRLRHGMFVAQVVGTSMEPPIPDGAWCLFRAPVEGARQGKTVLVQLRDAKDPETGERYTVKRYESKKAAQGDSWRHERITLKPVNPDFTPIVFDDAEEGDLKVIAELVEVLSGADRTGD